MIGWALVALSIVFSALLAYRLITDHRQWKKKQAEWERRIQNNWAQFIEAAERHYDDGP